MSKDYKDTLQMPKTSFPMRGNLGKNEPHRQTFWFGEDIYQKRLDKNKTNQEFVLPDGPPYANGDIHIGHALNKILKDMIVRDKSMRGYYTRYVPGWDTHGLPIETALVKNEKVDRKALSTAEFRRRCENYALKQIDNQRRQFKRLGVLGEWDNPYMTMAPHYEGSQLEVFADMVEKGLVFKGLKPVFWSPSSETALAEAEIEYKDKRDASIYFTFDSVKHGAFEAGFKFLVWTTTPWTIPANLALAVSSEIDYTFIEYNGTTYVLATALLEPLKEKFGWSNVTVIRHIKGKELLGLTYKHPLYDRESPVVEGHHVTIDSGTGLVHTAPGHGEDDFIIGKANNLDVLCPVDSKGHMTHESGPYEGMFIEKASKAVIDDLDEAGSLILTEHIAHSYPHDWRTKKPVIFRATDQWFASIENLKDDLMQEVKNVKWHPSWGQTRMENMIRDRESWCISRQRVWGVPIPVFYHENGEAILDADIIRHVAGLFKEHGSNIWFEWDASDLLPKGFTSEKSPNNDFQKETDILDVWFDSGTSHKGGMTDFGMPYPADLYLEGSDQYRGWFNSSLTTGVAARGKSPYKGVLTHGFVLDGEGRKMSKSMGNVVDPLKVMDQLGADILRLWVASVDYSGDVRISDSMIKQVSETYRKIRNTIRFMLGVLSDYDHTRDEVSFESMGETDRYMMVSLDRLIDKVNQNYDAYAFDDVSREINHYVTRELSAFYLDYIKDIVYIEAPNDPKRKSAQTVVYHTVLSLLKMLTPIIPHTTEEAYKTLEGNVNEESVYLENMPASGHYQDDAIEKKYRAFTTLRFNVLKALEDARNQKIIGKSLSAHVVLYPKDSQTRELLLSMHDLAQLFIVSKATIEDGQGTYDFEHVSVDVHAAKGDVCARCWQVTSVNDEGVCERCETVLDTLRSH